ncbi:ABC transporter substrate-binding protein [Piscinibacter sp. HJYY11]|uniref:ABC transporter substrate-binding protein n=1 Tax=Piscinibacter sp. HJYY11 TaxID=2801333 RepID=UPI00191D46B8|nr:ABC transporter substrate-binding protein [Piscinibacter sp. HJYY11]MBL0729619.1 carbohydrate ABC transporter substrate-binding protein [Piscinibacter sp. HJYY11]
MKKSIAMLTAAMAIAFPAAAQKNVEVLHFWTSGGEAAALGVLKSNLEKQGIKWNDMPVAGGGGEQAMTALRARVTSGNPPSAVLLMGYDLVDWANQGVLADLNPLAAKEGWDKVVPAAVQRFTKQNGKWIAAPLAVHSINWVWANKAVLEKAGVTAEPKTWDEFIAAAEKVQKAGFIALAHGGQPWQEATVFDSVVLATGGAEFYRKAFVELDSKALSSPTMLKVFQRMGQLRKLVDKDFSGRDWNVASGMVITGKAGFQIMGDWAKGEFSNAQKTPGKDYTCFPVPGTQGSVVFLSNQFAMFKVGADKADAQTKMASASLDPAVQSAFNVLKGAVPARTDVSDAAFDICGKRAMKELAQSNKANTLVGSIAHGHASPTAVKNAFYDVITRHFNGQLDDAKAVAAMVSASKS